MICIPNLKVSFSRAGLGDPVLNAPAETNSCVRRIRIGVNQLFWGQSTVVAHVCVDEWYNVWHDPENTFGRVGVLGDCTTRLCLARLGSLPFTKELVCDTEKRMSRY